MVVQICTYSAIHERLPKTKATESLRVDGLMSETEVSLRSYTRTAHHKLLQIRPESISRDDAGKGRYVNRLRLPRSSVNVG